MESSTADSVKNHTDEYLHNIMKTPPTNNRQSKRMRNGQPFSSTSMISSVRETKIPKPLFASRAHKPKSSMDFTNMDDENARPVDQQTSIGNYNISSARVKSNIKGNKKYKVPSKHKNDTLDFQMKNNRD